MSSYKSLKEHLLTEPLEPDFQGKRTDEVVGLLLAGSLLAYACGSLFDPKKSAIGTFLFGLGERVKKGKDNKDKDSKDTKDKDNKDTKTKTDEDRESYNRLLLLAKKSNETEKDSTTKKENESMLKLLTACSFDKNGNEIPFDQRLEKMKDALPEGTDFESFKKDMQAKYDKVKDDPEFKKQLEKAGKDIKEGDLEKFITDAKTDARKTWGEIEKQKEEQKKVDEEIKELEKRLQNASNQEKKELESKLKEKKSKLKEKEKTNSIFGSITVKSGQDIEKDEDGNILKKEKVVDKNTGKEIEVITHTGPRGGKFYYPDGKPKKPENRVYVESLEESIHRYKSLKMYMRSSLYFL